MSTTAFATLMNRYVFNYRSTPLTGLHVSPEGDQLHITSRCRIITTISSRATPRATRTAR